MKIFRVSLTTALLLLAFVAALSCAGKKNNSNNDTKAKKQDKDIIIDSDMTLEEALKNTKAPKELKDKMRLVRVQYLGFDGKLHQGQLVVHVDVEKDIAELFSFMLDEKFPLKKVVPIVKYNWSDDASMADDNTSAFNYRKVAGKSKLSNHSYGRAVDINPFENPAVYNNGRISPKKAIYSSKNKGTLSNESTIVKEFKRRGWKWGGDWNSLKDYQHFEKVDE